MRGEWCVEKKEGVKTVRNVRGEEEMSDGFGRMVGRDLANGEMSLEMNWKA